MLFSDSQSAVGILTLGWENMSHTSAIFEVKQVMEILKSQNVTVELNWTPDHAEIADKLAKEAAEEAENPRGGTLIFSAYVGSDPASALHPKKVSGISSTQKKIFEILATQKNNPNSVP